MYSRSHSLLPRRFAVAAALALFGAALTIPLGALARTSSADPVRLAHDAYRHKDARGLAAARDSAITQRHPLAQWADYWELSGRLGSVHEAEVQRFFDRWPGTYVEDRLRNDWLLELGRRRDWAGFQAELPKYRMNDDREVACYSLLVSAAAGADVRAAARQNWFTQREADVACMQLATSLYEAGQIVAADVWRKVRISVDTGQVRAARQAVALLGRDAVVDLDAAIEKPARFLDGRSPVDTRARGELVALALIRIGATDPEAAAMDLARWEPQLPADLRSWVWASLGRQAAIRLSPAAPGYFQRASQEADESTWPEETLAWKVRAALRAGRWQSVMQGINAMPPAAQRDPAWVYWKARALDEIGRSSSDGAMRMLSRELLASIAQQPDFYGMLAAETLGQAIVAPAEPVPLTAQETAAARANPGLARGLRLIALGMRSEAAREWNWTLSFGNGARMGDRDLLAAAQLACDAQVWDRCINTSERSRTEISLAQRFPTPFRREVLTTASQVGIDPAFVYGLVRQESRFIVEAASGVGASGLMQVMPATAQWTARKLGLRVSPLKLREKSTNIRIGTNYLKLVLDDMGGSQALAAAAYNAGPSRPRRWREGAVVDPAVWVESIPFSETRDYVKRVLVNAAWYDAVLSKSAVVSLRARLGSPSLPAGTLSSQAAPGSEKSTGARGS